MVRSMVQLCQTFDALSKVIKCSGFPSVKRTASGGQFLKSPVNQSGLSVGFECFVLLHHHCNFDISRQTPQTSTRIRGFGPWGRATLHNERAKNQGYAPKQTLLSYKLRWRSRKHDLVGFHEFLGYSAPF